MISGGSGGDVQVTLVLAPSPVLTLALASAVAPPAWRPPVPSTSAARPDRKSTRLNSSHEWISYAVFCLKKKKQKKATSKPAQSPVHDPVPQISHSAPGLLPACRNAIHRRRRQHARALAARHTLDNAAMS